MSKIVTTEQTLHRTTDGREFDWLHKAEAHQAELDIREMLADADITGDEQDLVIRACHNTLIYVPQAIWKDLMK